MSMLGDIQLGDHQGFRTFYDHIEEVTCLNFQPTEQVCTVFKLLCYFWGFVLFNIGSLTLYEKIEVIMKSKNENMYSHFIKSKNMRE